MRDLYLTLFEFECHGGAVIWRIGSVLRMVSVNFLRPFLQVTILPFSFSELADS